MGELLLSRRDSAIVAWHEVPGTLPVCAFNSVIAVWPSVRDALFTRKTSKLAAPDHTVPFGTALSGDAFPGTSCLATIRLSLRDKKPFAHRSSGLVIFCGLQ